MKNNKNKIMGVIGLSTILFASGFNNLDKYSNRNIDNIAFLNDEIHKGNYIKGNSITSNEGEVVAEDEYLKLVMQDVAKENDKVKREEIRKLDEERKQKELKRQQELAKKETEKKDDESEWMTFNASYYTSSCEGCTGLSASGVDVSNITKYKGYRIIASDNKVIPMWSIVEIKTPYETFEAIVLDRGGAIKGYKLDILVSSKKQAYRLGRHDVQLRIIRKGK